MKSAKELLEEAGLDDTVWGCVIINAEFRGGFTENDANDAVSWFFSADGDGILMVHAKRDKYGRAHPDHYLYSRGLEFNCCVSNNWFFSAAETLIKIEKRTIELLRSGVTL